MEVGTLLESYRKCLNDLVGAETVDTEYPYLSYYNRFPGRIVRRLYMFPTDEPLRVTHDDARSFFDNESLVLLPLYVPLNYRVYVSHVVFVETVDCLYQRLIFTLWTAAKEITLDTTRHQSLYIGMYVNKYTRVLNNTLRCVFNVTDDAGLHPVLRMDSSMVARLRGYGNSGHSLLLPEADQTDDENQDTL